MIKYSHYISPPNVKKNSSDQTTADTVQKAKSLLLQSGKGRIDPRAVNLMHLAETCLKNGNSAAARNFAQKAVQILKPKQYIYKEEKDPPQPHIPLTVDSKYKQPVEKQKQVKHTYQDVSSDPGVSFTYPAKLTAAQSFIAVPAHEAEHVRRRVSHAILNGERVMILVSYKIRYDPRTGQAYMAGGTTRAIKISDHKSDNVYLGTHFDAYV